MATLLKDIEVGATITFQSKNPNDLVHWRGTLEARGSYRTAQAYGDPRSFNEAVRQTDPAVPSDVTLLNYFLITIDNESSNSLMKAFAEEWIVDGSLNVITPGNQITIQVDDPNNDTQRILSLLANAGYSSTVIND